MSFTETETEDLLQLALGGDEQATQRLLVRHRERLRRAVAIRMDARLRARFDPSDAVQEAFIEAIRKLPAFLRERPMPFYPWLRRIALERLVDLRRRYLCAAGRSVTREAQWNVSNASIAAMAQQLIGSGTSPSGRLIRSDARNRVRLALEELPGNDREILLMRYPEQLRVAEIAEVLLDGLTSRCTTPC